MKCWEEIDFSRREVSPPAREAWIEIAKLMNAIIALRVASREGGVD